MMRNVTRIVLLLLLLPYSANAYREWTSWSKFSECSVTCGQGMKTQRRRCITVDKSNASQPTPPTMECVRSQIRKKPCFKLNCPTGNEACNCGCALNQNDGKIHSRVRDQKVVECIWSITTTPNSKVRLTISKMKSGSVQISQANVREPLIFIAKDKEFPLIVNSNTNRMNISIYYHYPVHKQGGIVFDAQFVGVTGDLSSIGKKSSTNTTVIGGISACAVVILIVIFIITYRKCRHTSTKDETIEEANEDNYSSASSSRSTKSKSLKQISSEEHNMSLIPSERRLSIDRPNQPQITLSRGYPDGREMLLSSSELVQTPPQSYIGHPQMLNWQMPTTSYPISQSTVTYTPTASLRHQPHLVTYPAGQINR